ncbi:MAG: LysR family transcriptional regulator [Ilumatobacteraceae bacterium]
MLQDIEIRQLRALQAVAAEGSFGRAAERLGFTQSAISQQIASLERAVGDKVFDRPGGPRRVELTPTGELLLAHATAMLDRIREAEDELRSLRAGEVGRLVVGSYQSVSVNILPEVVGRLRNERPGLSVRCEEIDENEVMIARLLSDDLDLSFLIGMPEDDSIEAVPLLIDPFVLLTAAADTPPVVDPATLRGAPMIGQSPCACQLSIDRSLRDYGVEPDYVFRTNDNAAVQAMVRAGMGQAILPFLAVDPNDRGVVVSSLDPPIPPRVVAIGRRRGRTLPPAADQFIELASEVCRTRQASMRELVQSAVA